MAEVQTGDGRKTAGRGVRKLLKRSTRVDLTPMVDLGFLLITFFIFTTSMSEPHAMKLRMPHDALNDRHSMQTPASGAVTVLLGSNNRIAVYFGKWSGPATAWVQSDYHSIRSLLMERKRKVSDDDLMVLIKSSPGATYRNCVDMLDEMLINDVRKYAFVEMDAGELALLGAE